MTEHVLNSSFGKAGKKTQLQICHLYEIRSALQKGKVRNLYISSNASKFNSYISMEFTGFLKVSNAIV